MSPRARTAALAAGLVVAVIAVAAIRAVWAGRRALAAGDAALREDRPRDAIAAWEEAARWYVPFAGHVDDAYARLAQLRTNSDHGVAIAALRAERSAAFATRALGDAHDPHAVDATLADWMGADPEGAIAAGSDRAARQRWQAARLARDDRPALGPSALAVAGVVLWLVGLGLGVGRIGRAGRSALGTRIALAMIAVGAGAWALGLYNV